MNAPVTFTSAYRQLRPSEKAFVDGYVIDLERDASLHGERISLALYRAVPADVVEASRGMLERPMVRAAIAERVNEIAAASELTVNRVVREIMAVAFATMEDFHKVGEDGEPYLDMTDLKTAHWAAVESIEVEMDPRNPLMVRKRKVKLHSKLDAIKMLATYTGMFEADNPHWQAEKARPINAAALPASVSQDGAADMYAQMLNGG